MPYKPASITMGMRLVQMQKKTIGNGIHCTKCSASVHVHAPGPRINPKTANSLTVFYQGDISGELVVWQAWHKNSSPAWMLPAHTADKCVRTKMNFLNYKLTVAYVFEENIWLDLLGQFARQNASFLQCVIKLLKQRLLPSTNACFCWRRVVGRWASGRGILSTFQIERHIKEGDNLSVHVNGHGRGSPPKNFPCGFLILGTLRYFPGSP